MSFPGNVFHNRGCRLISVLLISALSVSLAWAAESALKDEIAGVLAEEQLTGAAWMLISENGAPDLGAFGFSDNKNKLGFTTDTRFHVGSITKSLLSIGILRLATMGKIGLDEPIGSYLPNLQFDNPWRGEHDVTVRHLLDHTSGLDDARMWQMFSERPQADTPLGDAFPDSIDLLQIRARPGSQFSYSNMGYTLLGLVIESVTGTRYEAYLDQNLLAPLGMNDSTFEFTTQEGDEADTSLAWGHVDDGSRYAASPIFLRPAGQLTSTAGDLARFAQFLLDGSVLNGHSFIDPALMQSRGHPSTTDAAKNGLIAGYTLGIGRRDRHGVIGYCHGGNIVGFVAMLCIYPDEDKAFAYSVNTDSETADYGRIDQLLIRSLGVSPPSQAQTAEPAPDITQWYGRYVMRPNRFQTFEYLDTVFGAIKISAHAGSLAMTSLQNAPRQLRPLGGYTFSSNDRTTASHVFLKGDEGQYRLSDGFKTYEKVPGAFLYAHWLSVMLGLLGLAWFIIAGFFAVLRYRFSMVKRPESPAFVSILLLLIPIPFFLGQSFMALGDLTLASVVLAIATLLLPVGILLTLLRLKISQHRTGIQLLHGLAAVFVLQWCIVLAVAGLLPLRLWI
ncbi:MAG: beta-lactamase family protein [Xanthomonadales bacterium]|nr:beta-lactamase family protein [Xanthomonadales bacterium]